MNDDKDFISHEVHLSNDPSINILNQSSQYKKSLQKQREKQNRKSNFKTILWFLGLIVLNILFQVISYYGNYYNSFKFNWAALIWGSVLYCVFSLLIFAYSDIAKHPEKYEAINKAKAEARQKQIAELKRQAEEDKKTNLPKCPTCGSTNIGKISSFDKAAGAVMFGLFSKTAKSQFKCRNCGYKW